VPSCKADDTFHRGLRLRRRARRYKSTFMMRSRPSARAIPRPTTHHGGDCARHAGPRQQNGWKCTAEFGVCAPEVRPRDKKPARRGALRCEVAGHPAGDRGGGMRQTLHPTCPRPQNVLTDSVTYATHVRHTWHRHGPPAGASKGGGGGGGAPPYPPQPVIQVRDTHRRKGRCGKIHWAVGATGYSLTHHGLALR